jgi:hypothetical protein
VLFEEALAMPGEATIAAAVVKEWLERLRAVNPHARVPGHGGSVCAQACTRDIYREMELAVLEAERSAVREMGR